MAGTMLCAHKAGIPVFVTGGIGGVHREGQHSENNNTLPSFFALPPTPLLFDPPLPLLPMMLSLGFPLVPSSLFLSQLWM